MFSFGNNAFGQLGLGHQTDATTPAAVAALVGVIDVATYENRSYAVVTNGSAFGWGQNFQNGLCIASASHVSEPTHLNIFALQQFVDKVLTLKEGIMLKLRKFWRGIRDDASQGTAHTQFAVVTSLARVWRGFLLTPTFLRCRTSLSWRRTSKLATITL